MFNVFLRLGMNSIGTSAIPGYLDDRAMAHGESNLKTNEIFTGAGGCCYYCCCKLVPSIRLKQQQQAKERSLDALSLSVALLSAQSGITAYVKPNMIVTCRINAMGSSGH